MLSWCGASTVFENVFELFDRTPGSSLPAVFVIIVMVGLLIKIPCAPFHHWLLVAHVEASTSGSVILAGILLKLPAYALAKMFFSTTHTTPAVVQALVFGVSSISIIISSIRLWREGD